MEGCWRNEVRRPLMLEGPLRPGVGIASETTVPKGEPFLSKVDKTIVCTLLQRGLTVYYSTLLYGNPVAASNGLSPHVYIMCIMHVDGCHWSVGMLTSP